jgi:hypothetical protein
MTHLLVGEVNSEIGSNLTLLSSQHDKSPNNCLFIAETAGDYYYGGIEPRIMS